MPFKIVCPGCQKNYNLADELRGKAIRCKECSKTFKIPPASAQNQPAKSPAAPARQPVASQQEQRRQPQQANQSVPPQAPAAAVALRNENDLFTGAVPNPKFDPLGNHVIHDPGFAFVDPAKYAKPPEEKLDDNSLFYNPATADLVQKVAQAQVELGHEHRQFWIPAIVGGAAIALGFMIAVPMLFVGEGAAVIGAILLMLVSSLVAVAADIWLLVVIYRHDNERFILSLFIAFFRYQFLASNWEKFRDLGSFYMAGVLGCVGCAILFFIMGMMYGS